MCGEANLRCAHGFHRAHPLVCVNLGCGIEGLHTSKRRRDVGCRVGHAVVILSIRQERGRAEVNERGKLPAMSLQMLW